MKSLATLFKAASVVHPKAFVGIIDVVFLLVVKGVMDVNWVRLTF